MGVFYDLQSTKPENSRPRCAATSGHKFLTSHGFLIQIYINLRNFFTKLVPPLDPSAPDLHDPKISGPNVKPCASTCLRRHLRSQPQFHAPPHLAMCLHVPHVPSNTMTSLMTSSPTNWFDRLGNMTWSEPPETTKKKKKKKVRKKMLWPNGPLTLTKKSKFSKQTCLTQFFAYIPILESASLFETQKLCKQSNFQKVDFCTNLDQKSKFSRTCLAQFFA